jgi:hypothetical protein
MSELEERKSDVAGAGTLDWPHHLFSVCLARPNRTKRHTIVAGIAHAQSRARLPCKGAFETSSGEASVVPIQSIYESTRRVTWSARAGRDGSEDGKCFVSIEIVVDMIGRRSRCTVLDQFQPKYYVIKNDQCSPQARLHICWKHFFTLFNIQRKSDDQLH